MHDFSSGVSDYVIAQATVTVFFPVDKRGNADICCIRCPYLSSDKRMCHLNKELVAYPHNHVGDRCPLVEVEKKGD